MTNPNTTNYKSVFEFSTFFSNISFGDLLEYKTPSPTVRTKQAAFSSANSSPSQLKVDENITKQIKKYYKVKLQAPKTGALVIPDARHPLVLIGNLNPLTTSPSIKSNSLAVLIDSDQAF